jgi:hypothetical protein
MTMSATSPFLPAAAVAVAILAVAAGVTAPPDRDAEVDRIRAHLAAVVAELEAADVSALTPEQRAARARHIAVLREYREIGVFPHNHVLPGRRTPVFVDEHGTHCAVGYLLARDGRHDLVERIRVARNTATVAQLADDPDLVAWLEQAGLTLPEAARIQPWYDYDPSPEPSQRERSTAYTTASLVGAGLGGGMIAWNLLAGRDAAHTLPGVLGVGVGIAEISLAAYGSKLERTRERDIDRAHIVVNLGVGVLSSLVGVRTLTRATEPPRSAVGVELAPWVPAGDAGAGMQLNVRF